MFTAHKKFYFDSFINCTELKPKRKFISFQVRNYLSRKIKRNLTVYSDLETSGIKYQKKVSD